MLTLNLKTDKYIAEECGTWVALTQGDVVEMLFVICWMPSHYQQNAEW